MFLLDFPLILFQDKNSWTVPTLAQALQEVGTRIRKERVTLTIGGVVCRWTTSVFPEQE